jgi:hypothetical protein
VTIPQQAAIALGNKQPAVHVDGRALLVLLL